LNNLNPKVNLANILDDYNVKQYSRSNGTTQVALGYQQIDPKRRIPPPFSSLTSVPAVSLISILAFSIAIHWKALASGVSMSYRTTF